MATEKQIAANRRNSKLSTGPRTIFGKGKSRLNALSHGLSYVGCDINSGVLTSDDVEALHARDKAIFEGLQRVRVERARLISKLNDILDSASTEQIPFAVKRIAATSRYEGRVYSARKHQAAKVKHW